MNIKEVKYRSDMCSVTAGVTKNGQEQLKTRDLCVKTVMKPHKNIPERTDRITGQSCKMAKIIILLNLKNEQNITVLFSFPLKFMCREYPVNETCDYHFITFPFVVMLISKFGWPYYRT
jgi:hypothetical protein